MLVLKGSIKVKVRLNTDSSAAKGIVSRTGLGKVRHIEVNELWLQEKVKSGEIRMFKIPGTVNQGDLMTKHVPFDTLTRHFEKLGLEFRDGRAESAPQALL